MGNKTKLRLSAKRKSRRKMFLNNLLKKKSSAIMSAPTSAGPPVHHSVLVGEPSTSNQKGEEAVVVNIKERDNSIRKRFSAIMSTLSSVSSPIHSSLVGEPSTSNNVNIRDNEKGNAVVLNTKKQDDRIRNVDNCGITEFKFEPEEIEIKDEPEEVEEQYTFSASPPPLCVSGTEITVIPPVPEKNSPTSNPDKLTFICKVCNSCVLVSCYCKHMLLHKNEINKCNQCGKCFPTCASLNEHMQIHTDNKPSFVANGPPRTQNYTSAEKKYLSVLLKKFEYILENKKCDSMSLQFKEGVWTFICNDFNNSAVATAKRTVTQLKKLVRNLKHQQRDALMKDPANVDAEVPVITPQVMETEPVQCSSNVNGKINIQRQSNVITNENVTRETSEERLVTMDGSASDCVATQPTKFVESFPQETTSKQISVLKENNKKRKVEISNGMDEENVLKLARIKILMQQEEEMFLLNLEHTKTLQNLELQAATANAKLAELLLEREENKL